jgi:hypothetical protein
MDTFFEQIITRRPKGYETVLRILLIIFCAVLCVCLLGFSFFIGGIIRFLVVLAGFATPFLGYYIVTSLHTEYEYSVTNGYFDIDRITGKRKRARMLSTSCDKFEVFGKYDAAKKEQLSHQKFGAKILAANLDNDNLYYAILTHKEKGRTLVVIEPNERVLGAMVRFMPKMVAREAGFGK